MEVGIPSIQASRVWTGVKWNHAGLRPPYLKCSHIQGRKSTQIGNTNPRSSALPSVLLSRLPDAVYTVYDADCQSPNKGNPPYRTGGSVAAPVWEIKSTCNSHVSTSFSMGTYL